MKCVVIIVFSIFFYHKVKAQEIMLIGGLAMPIKTYAENDILNPENGSALNGYNLKLDYLILKQSSLNFSLGALYFSNNINIKSIEEQYNTVNNQKSIFRSLKPFSALGFGTSILYYFTPLKQKLKGFAKISIGQLFVNSPEYSITDSLSYIKYLTLSANSIYLNFGIGLDYSIHQKISFIAYSEYFYSKVDFGNHKVSNVSGQVITQPVTKINEQILESLNFNFGLSYKFNALEAGSKIKTIKMKK